MATSHRAFVLRHTRLRPVPGLEEIRLHLADDVLPLWRAVQVETADDDADLPYWAVAWAGGLAIARYLREHPETVAGRRVFDLASGSGLCAIAALRAGAAAATGADVDPFAAAAIQLNARANGCRVAVLRRDVLDDDAPEVDVIRRYLPTRELVELASYGVATTTDLEDLAHRQGRVYALRPMGDSPGPPRLTSPGAGRGGPR